MKRYPREHARSGALLEGAVIVLVGTNGVLAASEIAVVTSRRSRLKIRADQGDRRAGTALALADSPNRFLSTIQIGITSVAVIAGAFGGSRVARTLEPTLVAWGTPAEIASELAIVLVIVAITYLTLTAGELVPKRIALHNPERVAAQLAGPMRMLARLATPLVHVLAATTEAIFRFLPLEAREADVVTEDEIRSMIARAAESGYIEPTEQDIVDRLFRLSDTTVGMLMTPRESIVWLDHDSEITGLATLNDLLEGLVGELPVLSGLPAPEMIQREDGSWLVDGLLPFEESLKSFQQDATGVPHFSTLHSFMVEEIDGRPAPASVIHWRELRLEVVDMDGNRVDKVLVSVGG